MERLDFGRWIPASLGVTAGVVAVVVNYAQGNIVFATVLVVVFALIGWWSWPGRIGAHVSHAVASASAGDDDVIVYWRPG
ncbi:MAG: hypothetical protein ACR2QO_17330 [Acidimicrobiales bacterium]